MSVDKYNMNNLIQVNDEQIDYYERNLKFHYDTFLGISEKTNLAVCTGFIKFIFMTDDISKINEMIDKIVSSPQNDIFYKTEMYKLFMCFYKINNDDLIIIKKQLIYDNSLVNEEIKLNEIKNDELLREVKIVTKEKIELINETNLIEDEMSKYKHLEDIHIQTQSQNQTLASHYSYNPTMASSHSNNSGNSNNNTKSSNSKESEKKVKDLKFQMSKMEKSIIDAKKVYVEKKKKNDIYLKENEQLSQTTKQKVLIIEQIKEEIQQYKSIIEENKIDKSDSKSVISNSSTTSNGKEKKGFVGFVKGLFKK